MNLGTDSGFSIGSFPLGHVYAISHAKNLNITNENKYLEDTAINIILLIVLFFYRLKKRPRKKVAECWW